MAAYTLGWIFEQANQVQKALERYRQAEAYPAIIVSRTAWRMS